MEVAHDTPVREHLPLALEALEAALVKEGLDSDEDREHGIDVVTRALESDVVRDQALEVGDRRSGLLKRFEADDEGLFDYAALSEFLAQVKLRHPEAREAMILLEPEIHYQRLVDVMDTLRVARVDHGSAELFPDISIGDAPAHSGGRK
jgi:hypothetical protein